MGIYLNPGNRAFQESVNSKIYVDKTGLLEFTNSVIETEDKYICVSRPRRFGKSMAVKMLAAYYDRTCDSHSLFDGLKISATGEYEKRMNCSDVICLDISWFRVNAGNAELVVPMLQDAVIRELRERYPGCISQEEKSLPVALAEVNEQTGARFVIIIDEWDCLFREDKMDKRSQENYIELLRGLFKGGPAQRFISLAYLTGILPIKKYGTQSALNNFKEYTMVRPKVLAEYVGFTEAEVRQLCQRYDMDFEETRRWYDGYCFSGVPAVYSPNSVVEAMNNREFGNYWTETETYEDLKTYIEMDFDGLKGNIITMLGGGKCRVNTRRFQNDLTEINSRDDVLTLLVHLGYLAYTPEESEVFIPNQEVADEFENAVEDGGWAEIAATLRNSEELLRATLEGNAEIVAERLEEAHMSNASVLAYNNELSLSCVITIAYYSARRYYQMIRELPSGKGFADIAFIPLRHSDYPAMLVELKWDQDAEGAITQIKERKYTGALAEYADAGKLLLVGISYDKKNKVHHCVIERG